MPWLGIRGNGTLSHALPRKFRLAYRLHCIVQGFLLAANGLLTLIDPPGRSILDFGAALLDVLRAFARLVLDDLARFLTRLRREQHSDPDSDTQPEQKAGKSVLFHDFSFSHSQFPVYSAIGIH